MKWWARQEGKRAGREEFCRWCGQGGAESACAIAKSVIAHSLFALEMPPKSHRGILLDTLLTFATIKQTAFAHEALLNTPSVTHKSFWTHPASLHSTRRRSPSRSIGPRRAHASPPFRLSPQQLMNMVITRVTALRRMRTTQYSHHKGNSIPIGLRAQRIVMSSLSAVQLWSSRAQSPPFFLPLTWIKIPLSE